MSDGGRGGGGKQKGERRKKETDLDEQGKDELGECVAVRRQDNQVNVDRDVGRNIADVRDRGPSIHSFVEPLVRPLASSEDVGPPALNCRAGSLSDSPVPERPGNLDDRFGDLTHLARFGQGFQDERHVRRRLHAPQRDPRCVRAGGWGRGFEGERGEARISQEAKSPMEARHVGGGGAAAVTRHCRRE